MIYRVAKYYKDNISADAHKNASQMVEAGGDVLTGSAVLGVAGVAVAATGVGAPVAAAMEAGAAAGAVAGGAAVGGGTVLEASATAMDRLADYVLTGETPDVTDAVLDIGLTAGESLVQNVLLNKIPGGRLIGKLLGGKRRSAANTPGKKLPGAKPAPPKLEKTPPSRGGDDGKSRGKKEPKSDAPSDCCPKDSGPAGKRAHGRKPVHFGTGQEILQQTDFALERAVPLSWSRCYRSGAACEDGSLLGARWSSPYTTSLSLCLQGIVYHDHTGRALRLPLVLPGEHYDDRKEGFILSRTTPDTFVLTWRDGASDTFTRAGAGVLPHGYDGVNPVLTPGAPTATERFVLCRSQQRDGRGVGIERYGVGPVLLRLCFDDDTLIEALADDSSTRIAHVEEVRGSTRIRHVSYRYDEASGDLTSQTNLVGHSRHYAYQHHLLTSYTNCTGFSWLLDWISLASLQARWAGLARSDAADPIIAHNSHQARAICTRAFDDSEHTRIDYLDRDTSRVSENGGVLEYVFDANWLITNVYRVTDGVAISLGRREWDRDGMLLAEIDGEGHRTSFTYDGAGNLLTSTDALGNTSHLAYDAHNRLTSITDAMDNVSRRTYDDTGRPLTATDALGHTTNFRYDQRGNVIELTDAKGGSKRFVYNKAGQVIRHTDCSGHVTEYEYDAAGHLVAMRNALQHITRYEHDVLGRVTSIIAPDRTHEHYSYDADGNLLAHTDAAGHSTGYRYNGQGLPIKRVDPLGQTLMYRYDAALQLIELINASGESCRFSYHPEGWLSAETGFDGKSTQYRHDRNGKLVGIDCGEQSTSLIRDSRGLLLAKTTADGTIRYVYDALERLTAVSAPKSEQRFAYDALGQLLEERSACFLLRLPQAMVPDTPRAADASFTLTHAYDELGNRIRTTLPNGRRIDTLRYGSGHWHGTLWQGKPVADIERDRLHRETARHCGNLAVSRAYDVQSRLSLLRAEKQSIILRERHFSYDRAGHLTTITQHTPGVETRLGTLRYDYDPLGQLLGATQPDLAETFAFDPAGNLLDAPPAEPGHPPPLPVVTGNLLKRYQAWQYEHDAQGNVVRKYRSDGCDDLRFEYDADNRIVRSVRLYYNQRHGADYFYDPFSRRTAKRVTTEQWQVNQVPGTGEPCRSSTATTLFVWDGDKLVQELRQHDTVTYVYEPDSFVPLAICTSGGGWDKADAATHFGYIKQWQLPCDAENTVLQAEIADREGEAEQRHQTVWTQTQVAADDAAQSDKIVFYHCDHVGTPRELIDAQGKIVWAARYKAWGRIKSRDKEEAEQPLRFQGQYEDSETGLYYNRYRYYDPDSARYMTQDPVGLSGGLNFYQYARNPVRWIDPLGLAKYVVIGEGQGAIETYAATMRIKFPCDEFRTIRDDWKSIIKKFVPKSKVPGSIEFEEGALLGNSEWIKDRNKENYYFIDIGLDESKNRSVYYNIEKETLQEIGAKVFRGSSKGALEARKNSPVSNRPPSKKGCK